MLPPNPFEDLPEDLNLAFVAIERSARDSYRELSQRADENFQLDEARLDYLTAIHAGADVCEINEISVLEMVLPDAGSSNFARHFNQVYVLADRVVKQIQIRDAARLRRYSVELSADAKDKIHDLIGKIRQVLQAADLSEIKKNALFDQLDELAAEVNRSRTRFEIAMANILAFSETTGKALELAFPEPIRRFVASIVEIIANAKSEEPRQLPMPTGRPKLEGPKIAAAKNEKPQFSSDLDDEVPF